MSAETIFAPYGVTLFPNGAGILAEFDQWLSKQQRSDIGNDELIQYHVKKVLFIILKYAIQNREKFGGETTIPVTHIPLRELAYDLYAQIARPLDLCALHAVPSAQPVEILCCFGGMPGKSSVDTAIDWCEIGIEAIIAKLPGALLAIEEGNLPEDFTVYVMAPPISKDMRLAPDFTKRLRKEGMPFLAQIYVEYIDGLIRLLPKKVPNTLQLKGTSLGASIALEIGAQLLTKGIVHQDIVRPDTPLLKVRTSSPDGVYELSKPFRRCFGIFQVFGLLLLTAESAVYGMVHTGAKAIKRQRPEFVRQLDAARSFANISSDEAVQRPRRFWAWVWMWYWLLRGIPIPRGVKALMLAGKWDSIIPIYRKSGARVAKSTIMRINTCHLYPVYRESVLRSCQGVGRVCENLSRKAQS